MKTFTLAALTLAAMSSTAFAADLMIEPGMVEATNAPAISGDAMIYVGGLSLTDYYEDTSFTGWLVGAAGRVNVWLAPEYSAQFDLSGERVVGDDEDYKLIDLATHLSWRDGQHLLGVFGSLSAESDWWNGTFATIGVEAQVDLGQVLLYGQAGFTKSLSLDSGYDISAPYIRGEARYFLTPNLMVSANVGLVHEEYDGSADPITAATWGADIEYRFDDSPLSLFASYQGSYEAESSEDEDWVKHAVLVGVKFNFGDDSLQAASSSGATLRDYNPITGVQHLRYNDYE